MAVLLARVDAELSLYAIFGEKEKEMGRGKGTGRGRRKGEEGRGRQGRAGQRREVPPPPSFSLVLVTALLFLSYIVTALYFEHNYICAITSFFFLNRLSQRCYCHLWLIWPWPFSLCSKLLKQTKNPKLTVVRELSKKRVLHCYTRNMHWNMEHVLSLRQIRPQEKNQNTNRTPPT